MTGQRSRKTEILFRLEKIGLETQGGFVMLDRRLVLPELQKNICQFFVGQSKVWIYRETAFEWFARFLQTALGSERMGETKLVPRVSGFERHRALLMLNCPVHIRKLRPSEPEVILCFG